MAVKKGDKVKVDYTGTLDDGTVFDSSIHGEHSHPLEFTVGNGEVIKGFDDALMGMKLNEEKSIHIPMEDAYGPRVEELVQTVPRSSLPPGELKAGMVLGAQAPTGEQFMVVIVSVNDKEVVLDLNNPMAGKALNFKIKLLEIVK